MATPTTDAVRARLAETAPLLDLALARTGRASADELLARPNGLYDLRVATDESYGLSKGLDLCYDRPSTGLVYGLWYHARRVNTCLRQVVPSLVEARPGALVVYDLGAGTGAFLWAFALAAWAIRQSGGAPPAVHVVNVDSSPVMLDYLARAWAELVRVLPEVGDGVTWESAVNSWTRSEASATEGWLCASYLFDHSDKADDLSRDFDALLETHQPSRVLLSTSMRKGHDYFRALAAGMGTRGYGRVESLDRPVFSGLLREVNVVRAKLSRRVSAIRPVADWKDPSYAGAVFAQTAPTLGVERPVDESIQLFMAKLPKRRHVELTPEQSRAAALSDRPTLVWGAAGSGKSIVLTERIRLLVEDRDFDPDLRILVTTFNKQLVHQVLKPWMFQLLGRDRLHLAKMRRGAATYEYHFVRPGHSTSLQPNLSIMHFDALPTRIGRVQKIEGAFTIAGDGEEHTYEEAIRALISEAIDQVRARLPELGVAPSQVPDHVFDVGFVSDELHRVVYGQSAYDRETYLHVGRPGRTVVLQRGGKPREILWEVLDAFSALTKDRRVRTFLQRRIHLLDLLETGGLEGGYTHLLVDEVQDCTPADLRIFHRLLRDPEQLFVTGDLAQAVHLGRSAPSRPHAAYPEIKGVRSRTLKGSFRLPFRISEALVPLSSRIGRKWTPVDSAVDVAMVHPYKGSPPGVRPVIVSAETEAKMARKLREVGHAYGSALGPLGFDMGAGPLILEHDAGLRKAMQAQGDKAWTDTILRVKGLEHPWVVWSTRAEVPADDDAEEFVYTILTRGSGVLVIALFPNPSAAFQAVLNTFEPKGVLVWDEASASAFQLARNDRELETDVEPHLQDATDD